ncbi:Aste57867_9069 [Aphanomyces stellatus]|uniref:Aste57867_9069 protein n=1 Tax=Aphanomyces stellatus TaxID=120398 RepID=A0A485KLV2_9STRA|nr:hypothetical protein As57867_009033 [Aphanomyces stellatus]VFT85953.1 Aste57867_9069 [Aphanomyces stellatus]
MDDDEWDDAAWEAVAMEAEIVERSVTGQQSHAAPSEWACPRCTFRNASTLQSCNMCAYSRTQAKPSSQSTAPPSNLRDSSMSSWLIAPKSVQPANPSTLAPPKTYAPQPTSSRPPPAGVNAPARAPPLNVQVPRPASATASRPSAPSASSSRHAAAPAPRPRPSLALPPSTQSVLSFAPSPMVIPEESVVMGADIDRDLATKWIYPSNYPVRSYQQTISRAALVQNTLVCLPTGLGKTLIAAVVMFNFYRWFPRGKIVFMAPTKPLVSQQIQACHDVMPIPQSDMAELQGNVAPAKRKLLWSTKRAFFCTPQSLYNDIERGNCDVRSFVCVVVDEAHRATGNYAYVLVIKAIAAKISGFRVLALSATPGSKFDVIQEVLTNLRISHIECKNGDDPDVRMYTHSRQEEIIKCKLNKEVTGVRTQYFTLFQPVLHRLCSSQVLHIRDPEKLNRWLVIQSRDRMRANPQGNKPYRTAEADLALLVSLLHGKDVLTIHGIGNFKSFLENFKSENFSGPKRMLIESPDFIQLQRLVDEQAAGGRTESNNPKLVQLQQVLSEHFSRHQQGGSSTRSIVFTQYRESVNEIVTLLSTMAPLIKVKPFIGQGSSKGKDSKGQTQKQQQEIVAKFRDGEFNVLVATCIAEEGLDIGEVDLIVSFDCLTSPVRMIQRMGRTGRKRVGRVVLLVTEGDEEKKLERSVSAAKSVNRSLTVFKDKFKCVPSARMIPKDIVPQITESEMVVPTFHASLIGGKKGAKKNSFEGTNNWQLNEDENQVLQMKHPGRIKQRKYLFSFLLPSRLSDYSKPHHFGRSRRSRCLLQLLHRVHANERMSNAEFFQRYRHAVDQAKPVDTIPSQLELSHEDIRPDDVQDDPINLSFPENEFQHSFPMSYNEEDKLPPASATPSDVDHGLLNDSIIEIPSSPEEESKSEPPPAPQETIPSNSPPKAKPISSFFTKSHEQAKQMTSPPPKSKGKSPMKQTSSPAKAQGSPSRTKRSPAKLFQGSSPTKQLPLHDSFKTLPVNNHKRTPTKASSYDISQSNAHSPIRMDFSLDTSVDIMKQGEQVIAMLEHLSTRQLTSPENSQPKTPPQLSPLRPAGIIPSRSFPRLFSPSSTISLPPPSITEVVVPKAPSWGDVAPRIDLNLVTEAPQIEVDTPMSNNTPTTPTSNVEHVIDSPPFAPKGSKDLNPISRLGQETKNPPGKSQKKLGFTVTEEESDFIEENAPYSTTVALLPTGHLSFAGSTNASPGNLSSFTAQDRENTPTSQPPQSNKTPSKPPLPKANSRLSFDAQTPSPAIGYRKPVVVAHKASFEKMGKKRSLLALPTVELVDSKPRAPMRAKEIPKTSSVVRPPIDDDDFIDATPSASTPKRSPFPGRRLSQGPGTPSNDDCQVCGNEVSTDADPILFCDGCNVAVHQHCYGVRVIPADEWFCDACVDKSKPEKCVLCPVRKGALKKTLCKQWVHVQCYLWTPELAIRVIDGCIQLGSLETLARFARASFFHMKLCHTTHGYGIVQCAHRSCLRAFHVSCASTAKYKLIEREGVEEAQFVIYCPGHASVAKKASDDFVTSSETFRTPVVGNQKKRKRLKKASSPSKKKKRRASKQLISHYIEMEADISEDDSPDEDEEDEEGQLVNSSFIDDGSPSQYLSPAEMQAIYRRRDSNSPMFARHLPSNGVVAQCLADSEMDMSMEMDGEVLHHGFSCDECKLDPIEGVRYTCQRCPSYDLCMCCYSARSEFHPKDHKFITIDEPLEPLTPAPNRRPQVVPPTRPQSSRDAASARPMERNQESAPPRSLETKRNPQETQKAMTDAELTAQQVARMEESRRKALELQRKRMEESRRLSSVPVIPVSAQPCGTIDKSNSFQQPTKAAPTVSASNVQNTSKTISVATVPKSVPNPISFATAAPDVGMPNTVTTGLDPTIRPLASILPSVPPPPTSMLSAAPTTEVVEEMPSFSLMSSFNLMSSIQVTTLCYSIAYHPRVESSSLLLDVFRHGALPKLAEPSLECDLLLSTRLAVQVYSFADFYKVIQLPQCPHLQCLQIFGKLTYIVQSTSKASAQAIQECRAYVAKFTGMDLQWTGDPAHTLRLVLQLSGQESTAGFALAQYQQGQGKDGLFMDRWTLFHHVPLLGYGGQQALANRFGNLSVAQITQMNTKFNPMHWKRMLPWITDAVAQSIYQYVHSKM